MLRVAVGFVIAGLLAIIAVLVPLVGMFVAAAEILGCAVCDQAAPNYVGAGISLIISFAVAGSCVLAIRRLFFDAPRPHN